MRQQLKLTSLAVGFLSVLASPTLLAQGNMNDASVPATQSATDKNQQAMLALAAKTEELQKQLVALQQQIAQMKQAQNNQVKATKAIEKRVVQQPQKPMSSGEQTQFTAASPEASLPYPESPLSVHRIDRGDDEKEGSRSRYYPTALTADGKVLTYLAGVPVVTSPYLGQRPAFDGSDLIINISRINQDIRLMEQRQVIEQQFVDQGYAVPDTPILMLSGTLQPLFTYQKPYSGSAAGNMTMDSAELDTTALINPWVEGLMSLVYTSEPPAEGGDITSNSSVSVDKAFINVGNLDKTPFYMTAGQVYVPFGQFASNMVSGPMITALAKTQVRSAMFGFAPESDNSFFGTVYAYNSDTTLNNSGAGGANLVYQFGDDHINGNFGVSLTSNMGDASGLQDTGAGDGQFGGFGVNSDTELVAQVPAYDLHGVFNVGAYSFLGEFVSSMKQFDASALSYNGEGAQPMGLNFEAARTFKFLHKPATFAVGYGWTDESVALQLPQQRISATVNVSWWRDTIQSLEFRHDMDYASSNYGSGIGSSTDTFGTGSSADTVSALFSVFF